MCVLQCRMLTCVPHACRGQTPVWGTHFSLHPVEMGSCFCCCMALLVNWPDSACHLQESAGMMGHCRVTVPSQAGPLGLRLSPLSQLPDHPAVIFKFNSSVCLLFVCLLLFSKQPENIFCNKKYFVTLHSSFQYQNWRYLLKHSELHSINLLLSLKMSSILLY